MTLSSIIVSRDWPEVSVLECILGGMQIEVDVEPRPERASRKLATGKFDALILDTDLEGVESVLAGLKQKPNQEAMPIGFISRSKVARTRKKAAASFVLQKPISVENAVHTFSAARNEIVRGRLRYHRASLQLPMWLTCDREERVSAKLVNLSQGGVCIQTKGHIPPCEELQVNFALPGSATVEAAGRVVWTGDEGTAGIKFMNLGASTRQKLQLWLEQKYFTN